MSMFVKAAPGNSDRRTPDKVNKKLVGTPGFMPDTLKSS